jgi:tetratricopeptide (TPR) repeat protein
MKQWSSIGLIQIAMNLRSEFERLLYSAVTVMVSRSLVSLAIILSLGLLISCGESSEQNLRRAAEAWDSGDYSVAAEEYEQYLAVNPTGSRSSEARFQLANIYYLNLRKYEAARSHYVAFLSHDPAHANSFAARERLAEVLAELGRSYEAIAEFENLNPQDDNERRRIRLRIAELYVDQKNYNQALTEYEKVTEAHEYDEMSEQAYQREAAIYHITRAQYQLALPLYQKLATLTKNPETRRRALYGVSDCYSAMYRFDEAIKTLREIKDEGEQPEITRRISNLEQRRREVGHAWSGRSQP